ASLSARGRKEESQLRDRSDQARTEAYPRGLRKEKVNCPYCRKKLWYDANLSYPNPPLRRLVYACASCRTLFKFEDFPAKLGYRGVLVVKETHLKTASRATRQILVRVP